MFINFNSKLFAKVSILCLFTFLPSCAAIDIYNAEQESRESLGQAKETEGEGALSNMARFQESYHYERETFASNVDDLGIVLTSLQYYDVEIVEADNNKAIFTAKAKEKDIRSFAGIIEYQDESLYKTLICETLEPAKSITLPIDVETCGSDSQEIYKKNRSQK